MKQGCKSSEGHRRGHLTKPGLVEQLTQPHVQDLQDGQRHGPQTQLLVLKLQVPVTYILEMQVLDGQCDLEEEQLCLGLVQL